MELHARKLATSTSEQIYSIYTVEKFMQKKKEK